MEPVILTGMIFTLVVLALVGGFVLLFPLTRQLAAYLERRLQGSGLEAIDRAQVIQIRKLLEDLEVQVAELLERQDFTEKLLEGKRAEGGLLAGDVDPGPPEP